MVELGPIKPFDTRGWVEKNYLRTTFRSPFSGYLGGIHKGGYWVERLEEEWKSTFNVKYAIPCNSATSGLLAACMAAGIKRGDLVWVPVYTMSATASCAIMLGANVKFIDIEPTRFSMNMTMFPGGEKPKTIIVTNLFGNPAYLNELRSYCDSNNIIMIEDNAQGVFAHVKGKYAGTIGHLGVFSFNIHKHIQCGEGGVVVTGSDDLAIRCRDAINHGELRRGGEMGLNLRMTEPTASLACAQLSKASGIIAGRRELALELTDMVRDIKWITPPYEAPECQHVYYQWAAKVNSKDIDFGLRRRKLVQFLNKCGFPMNEGYSPLLSDVFPAFGDYPVARRLEDKDLITFEVCSHDPNPKQRKQMREIFKQAEDTLA